MAINKHNDRGRTLTRNDSGGQRDESRDTALGEVPLAKNIPTSPPPGPSVPSLSSPVIGANPDPTGDVPETATMKTPSGATQVVCPAVPPAKTPSGFTPPPNPVAPAAQPWVEATEKWLVDRGWRKLGTNDRGYSLWEDPKTSADNKPVHKPAVKLPVQGGGEEIVRQWHCPPANWALTTDEALMRQQERELAGETLEELIRRKRRELSDLEDALEQRQLAAERASQIASNGPMGATPQETVS